MTCHCYSKQLAPVSADAVALAVSSLVKPWPTAVWTVH